MAEKDNKKKQVPLRLSAKLYDAIAAWAEDDFRSVNGQIEYLLTECVRQRKKNGKYVVLEVRNYAACMKKGKHMDLFERFYRADSSHNSTTGGHGIGLSNAQAIVELHKGKITAYSPADGQICFQIRL